MAGYSETPLARKLGIKAGSTILVVNPTPNYDQLVAPLPGGVRRAHEPGTDVDLYHLFTRTRNELQTLLTRYRSTMRPEGTIWVSWPKKSSGVPSEVTEDVIRDVALPMGLVDVKVCAVDETWSGLKLVLRRENRG